jgi:2,5-diketo-D-gluconate reductase A
MTDGAGSDARRVVRLADDATMPLLGFGVWQVPDGPECEDSVLAALELGYRHVDTAQVYGNEASVGRALRASGVPRDEVFVATKFMPANTDPVAELELSLERLGLDHVDLYLVHWPQGGATWMWPGMEDARERGLTRSIGVSNFSVEELAAVSAAASTPPAVNQVQYSPFRHRRGLLDACRRHDVVLESYSTLGTGRNLDDPTVAGIAQSTGRTPAQVLLRWCVQRDIPVIPKSVHRERIAENAQLFDFALSGDEMRRLDDLDETDASELAREERWW